MFFLISPSLDNPWHIQRSAKVDDLTSVGAVVKTEAHDQCVQRQLAAMERKQLIELCVTRIAHGLGESVAGGFVDSFRALQCRVVGWIGLGR